MVGFEPTKSCSQNKWIKPLSHTQIKNILLAKVVSDAPPASVAMLFIDEYYYIVWLLPTFVL